MLLSISFNKVCGIMERARERGREGERETGTETERERERETDRQTDRQRQRENSNTKTFFTVIVVYVQSNTCVTTSPC